MIVCFALPWPMLSFTEFIPLTYFAESHETYHNCAFRALKYP